ncbi:MAG: flagellar biosynthesis anti-sigma factor FlgM [Rhodospirillales bacterium]
MIINDSLLSQAAASELGKTHKSEAVTAGGARRESAAQPQEGDRVQLSGLSGRLLEMLAVHAADREARVERLATDYRAGRYQPDALAVSRGIIRYAMEA